jgi:hypothetical protein
MSEQCIISLNQSIQHAILNHIHARVKLTLMHAIVLPVEVVVHQWDIKMADWG